ncbi:alpha-tocopherol transfer protein-like [Hyposmocoma kahamanoa]|uniref:alpha-tocopherol transfer protein-like n=1 Tax=Hyposmocoma kahamanoa TaxID=1477025 RepID=UPI000E6D92FD|nr:alpha-tocopherol transfer protein-like [Hyposmocoma kahamanoa]
METLPKSPVLKFPPDTLKVIRKSWDLDGPGRMKEAIDILEEWIKKQQHFVKKDFPRDYLEITLICSKGSVERAKKRLDKVCTLRTFVKSLFGNYDLKNDFNHLFGEKLTLAPLPTLTKDYCRIIVLRFNKLFDAKDFTDMYRALIIYFDYLRVHDYVNGYIIFNDYKDVNILEFASKINILELGHIATTIIEGFGVRIKGIYLLSTSKLIDAIIAIFKQVLSAKLGNRIYVTKTVEEFHERVPKEILPKDYGGNEKNLAELHDDWIEELSSEEFTKHRNEMNEACTNENLRPVDTFNDQHLGMPGTFRTLSLD